MNRKKVSIEKWLWKQLYEISLLSIFLLIIFSFHESNHPFSCESLNHKKLEMIFRKTIHLYKGNKSLEDCATIFRCIQYKGSLQKKSVDFFHTGGEGPGQIHTFRKVWKIGCFLALLCIFARFWPLFTTKFPKIFHTLGEGREGFPKCFYFFTSWRGTAKPSWRNFFM